MKFIDLTGKIYGRLTVISRAKNDKFNHTRWNCACSCGNKKVIGGAYLKNGKTISCGCYLTDMLNNSIIDITGNKYGRLTVISLWGRYKKQTYWNCECDCGTIVIVNGSGLKDGKSSSCGCYKKEKSHDAYFIDLGDKKFGMLKVLKLNKIKDEQAYWDCICDCGNKTTVLGNNLKRGNTKSCGCQRESYVSSGLKKYFINNYGAISEYKILKNPDTRNWLPYDIYLPEENIFIEINGEQHYKFKKYWHKTEEKFKYKKKLDRMKRRYARKNGVYIEIDLRKIKTTEEAIIYIENRIKNK